MNELDQADLAALDAVMAELLPLDNYARLRVYRQVQTFFGFEPVDENSTEIRPKSRRGAGESAEDDGENIVRAGCAEDAPAR